MGVKNPTFAIDQKIAAALINIVLAVILALLPFAQQAPIELQGCRGKNPQPRKSPQGESAISYAIGVGQQRERPGVALLILEQLRRVGEGNHRDGNATPFKLRFKRLHLAEVSLAGQSSEMSKKDEKQKLLKVIGKSYPVAAQIEQLQILEDQFVHGIKRLPQLPF